MRKHSLAGAAVIAVLLAGGPVLATNTMSPAEQSADHDFGKLSKDGMKAFHDIRDARMMIFQGNTSGAEKDINQASAELQSAKADDTSFDKAEADIKTPAGMTQAKSADATTKVTWLPVDGAMTLNEDYTATPDKSKSVDKADAQLKTGDHNAALDTLKLADVDVNFVAGLAPLHATIEGVAKAKQLADTGHYFQANQALKAVEDGVRFDDESFVATPKANTTGSQAKPDAAAGK